MAPMRAAVYRGPGDVRVETVPDPEVSAPTDAVVRITHACICGSDLWFFRGQSPSFRPGMRTGHELMGVVEAVGEDVSTVRPGDRVIAPFVFSDGTCEMCRRGLTTSCRQGGAFGGESSGGQAELARVPFAAATLVRVDEQVADDDPLLTRLLPLTDVLPTGHHGCVMAGVAAGETVAVIGDGAVGLCAVLAARRLGAERIVILGHHEDRLTIARRFGATDVVEQRGDEAVQAVRELTDGGAMRVVEAVGTQPSLDTAVAIARPGGGIGCVGVPHTQSHVDVNRLFAHNIGLRLGVAPVRTYLGELLPAVLAGELDPSPVLDMTVDLDGVPGGYAAMDERRAIKVMVRPG
jgi:threonine dehydrogenase-like Zn-dependent dehydrogenase